MSGRISKIVHILDIIISIGRQHCRRSFQLGNTSGHSKYIYPFCNECFEEHIKYMFHFLEFLKPELAWMFWGTYKIHVSFSRISRARVGVNRCHTSSWNNKNNLCNIVTSISMVQCKTAITLLLMHWSCCSLVLKYRYGIEFGYHWFR